MSVYKKLTKARKIIWGKDIPKSGHNPFGDFDYYELKDFMPLIVEINEEVGLLTRFTISENAMLFVYDVDNPEEELLFESPIAEFHNKKSQPIQELGAKHTYLKRYLYMNAYEITEKDLVDRINQEENMPQKKPQYPSNTRSGKTPDNRKSKVTTKQLKSAITNAGMKEKQILAKYFQEHGEVLQSLEYMPEEHKISYFERIKNKAKG